MLKSDLINILVAMTIMWLAANIPPHYLQRFALPVYLLGLLLLIGVALFGEVVNGARRWLHVGVTRIQPSELCTDAEFIRRVSLDVCGVLPTSAETEQFIAEGDPAKRENLVDKLLARKEFVELWVMKWSELLQMRSS